MTGAQWLRTIKREFEPQRIAVDRTNGGHLRLTLPNSKRPIFIARTPSDWRAIRNVRAFVRRALTATTSKPKGHRDAAR